MDVQDLELSVPGPWIPSDDEATTIMGAAMIQSNSGAIVADNFPQNKRGRVFGYTAVGYNAGAMLGIVLGGHNHNIHRVEIYLLYKRANRHVCPVFWAKTHKQGT